MVLRIENGTITEVGRIDHSVEGDTVGQTDCRRLGIDDFPTEASESGILEEFTYLLAEDEGMVLLACGDGESHRYSGYECWHEPWADEELRQAGVFDADEVLVTCWHGGQQMPQISRSLVLPGGELWTVSSPWGWLGGDGPARLQINDLLSLARIDAIEI